MTDHIADFFPSTDQDTWKFFERSSGSNVTVNYLARPHASRTTIELELTGLPPEFNPAFFDRLTLTEPGLELNRIQLRKITVDINPPMLVTLNLEESNQVATLFPDGSVPILYDLPPLAGKVTSKKLSLLSGQRKQFEVKLVSTARAGEQVFRVRMQFQSGRGLTDYRGDMGGIFFVYERAN